MKVIKEFIQAHKNEAPTVTTFISRTRSETAALGLPQRGMKGRSVAIGYRNHASDEAYGRDVYAMCAARQANEQAYRAAAKVRHNAKRKGARRG